MMNNTLELVLAHKAYLPMLRLKSKITGFLVGLAIPILTKVARKPTWTTDLATLRTLEAGTLGKDIANALDKNGFDLIPKFEHHDAQHILMGYDMTGFGEIQVQFFLLGNGHITFLSIAACVLGVVVFPEWIPKFKEDFRRGKRAKCISKMDFETKIRETTSSLKSELSIFQLPIIN